MNQPTFVTPQRSPLAKLMSVKTGNSNQSDDTQENQPTFEKTPIQERK